MRHSLRRTVIGAILTGGMVGATLAMPAAAQATPGTLSWTTFFRDGPDIRAKVIDELQTSTPIDVLDCAGGWCRIRVGNVLGYVSADAVQGHGLAGLPSGHTGQPVVANTCFPDRQWGYDGFRRTVICQEQK